MPQERVKRRHAAIVSVDTVGWSSLMGDGEPCTLAALKRHRKELIDSKIEEHGGRIVNATGDGLLIEFSSAVDDLNCSIEVPQAMVGRNADLPENR